MFVFISRSYKKGEVFQPEVIQVTRFNGSQFYLNADLIQTIESTPDTVITLVNNVKMVVKEAPDVVVDRIIAYRHRINQGINVSREEK